MPKLTEKSSADYRRATVETMALLIWLRRFAEAQLAKEEDEYANS
jgi:CRISPR/Cas system CMR-associated protein Cmr5 small subunit